jgi:hypothetical protein
MHVLIGIQDLLGINADPRKRERRGQEAPTYDSMTILEEIRGALNRFFPAKYVPMCPGFFAIMIRTEFLLT